MNLIEQAMMFATQKHVLDNKQLYGQLLPYTHHLAAVEQVLLRYKWNGENMRAAAWLHDVVEDTVGRDNEVRVRDIEEIFGEGVAVLVGAVTSVKGENRKIRNALTYPNIRDAGNAAVALKLADRIANMEFRGRASDMYIKEHPGFKHGIYLTDKVNANDITYSIYQMQEHLDGLIEAK